MRERMAMDKRVAGLLEEDARAAEAAPPITFGQRVGHKVSAKAKLLFELQNNVAGPEVLLPSFKWARPWATEVGAALAENTSVTALLLESAPTKRNRLLAPVCMPLLFEPMAANKSIQVLR